MVDAAAVGGGGGGCGGVVAAAYAGAAGWASNTFGAFNPDGSTRTFFKPDPAKHKRPSNWDYWLDQPGQLVRGDLSRVRLPEPLCCSVGRPISL